MGNENKRSTKYDSFSTSELLKIYNGLQAKMESLPEYVPWAYDYQQKIIKELALIEQARNWDKRREGIRHETQNDDGCSEASQESIQDQAPGSGIWP